MVAKTQLCLSVVVRDAADGERFAAAMGAAPLASVTLTPAPGINALAVLKPLVQRLQKDGIAVLVTGDIDLARTLRADGVHVPWSQAQPSTYAEAREAAGAHMIVGADAGRSRHTAMELGEGNADYVAFGIPEHVGDRTTAEARQINLIAWWSEIFEVPCMAANVTSAEHAARLADAGADFVSVDIAVDGSVDTKALVNSYHKAMAQRVTA
jgi:thiamine-phosphate pyrophosphorylase